MKNILKNKVFSFVLGAIIFTTVGAYAATIIASEIPYTNNNQENVQGAIDDLYDKSKNHCPDNKMCINKTEMLDKNPICYDNQSMTNTKKCRRATFLHTEKCQNSSNQNSLWYCTGSGYTTTGNKHTSTIIYGNCGIIGQDIQPGDAFDCDVNGDGAYDEETERFYYLSEYYNTETKQFDNDTVVLIYYNNVSGGLPNNTLGYAYDNSNLNYNGPQTAKIQLPTTEQWNNISLKNQNRVILTESAGNVVDKGNKKLPGSDESHPKFSYSGYAARLMTHQEYSKAGGASIKNIYLLENTAYSNENLSYSYWLETPLLNYNNVAFSVYSDRVGITGSGVTATFGVRPVIEVPISDIEY